MNVNDRRGDAVETPVGTMYLRHVGWGVLIDNWSNQNVSPFPYLTISGKLFAATIGVYPDGTIERQTVEKVDKIGGMSTGPAAPSYVEKIVHAARVAVHEYIVNNPVKVAEGVHYRASMDYESAQAALKRIEPEYEAAVKRRREAQEWREETRVRLLEAQAAATTAKNIEHVTSLPQPE
jgi:hypothetical protein